MWNRPDERMAAGNRPDDTREKFPSRQAPPQEEPKRTPSAAEGTEGQERKMPQDEPGRTPGSAEGGNLDEPSRR
jgi:hypothetical protein